VPKDITEKNQLGQSFYILPWFWRIGESQPGPSDIWDKEYKCYKTLIFEFPFEIHICLKIHKVSWLKARAKYER
jgi:hypothetical protein